MLSCLNKHSKRWPCVWEVLSQCLNDWLHVEIPFRNIPRLYLTLICTKQHYSRQALHMSVWVSSILHPILDFAVWEPWQPKGREEGLQWVGVGAWGSSRLMSCKIQKGGNYGPGHMDVHNLTPVLEFAIFKLVLFFWFSASRLILTEESCKVSFQLIYPASPACQVWCKLRHFSSSPPSLQHDVNSHYTTCLLLVYKTSIYT